MISSPVAGPARRAAERREAAIVVLNLTIGARMRHLLAAILTASLGWAAAAVAADFGKADGSLSAGQGDVVLKTAYVTQYYNEEALADVPELRILLADRKVDLDQLAGPRGDGVERLARKGQLRGILLRLDPTQLSQAPVRGTLLVQPPSPSDSLMHFTITGDSGGFDALQVTKDRAQGKVQFQSAPGTQPAFSYRAGFSAPLVRDLPTARLIGARAQESPQAKAVLAFERALLEADMAEVGANTTPERFAGLDADFLRVGPVVFLEQVRAQLPDPTVRPRQIREVVIHGRRAWVVMVKDDGTRTVAALAHRDGAWKVD
jgi:hypothetical protein